MKPALLLLPLLLSIGCGYAENPATTEAQSKPVVPPGFNEKMLDALKCPENSSALRLANGKDLSAINGRISAGKMKTWMDEPVEKTADALLIRADGKIAYRFEDQLPNVPNLKIDDALVLDARVGPPNPSKNRQ